MRDVYFSSKLGNPLSFANSSEKAILREIPLMKLNTRLIYLSGILLGLSAVILGALGAHALEKHLTANQLDSFETAVRFQMYHALFLLFLGKAWETKAHRLGQTAIALVILGTLLFSGSIYLLVLSSVPVGIVTPIGGMLLIVGWGVTGRWLWKTS
ncbi:MAG: DUF423 domain-containing protein [Bacteroidota bacterium]